MINLDDFRFILRGRPVRLLKPDEINLLAPIDKRGEGKQKALLLLHGFASSPAVYRYLIPTLTSYDAVVCPALPGHATSIEDFSTATASEWFATAENACKELLTTYETVDVMGLSLGGLLALQLSQRYPVHHLYLLAPALVLKLNLRLALACARGLHYLGFRRLYNRAGNLHSDDHAELTYRQVPLSSIIEVLTLIQSTTLEAPSCPVDLFLGSYDEVVDSSAVAELFSTFSNVQYHWLTHSAHVLPLDGDLAVIKTLLA